MVLIYSSEITPRLKYVVSIIFGEVLGVPYNLLTDPVQFQKEEGKKKISYTEKPLTNSLIICPSGFLEETGVHDRPIETGQWEGLPTLFPNACDTIPFDLFSASFYLVSRYEEYLPFRADSYGRFPAEESLAGRKNFLRLPLVDLWSLQLARLLNIEDLCPSCRTDHYRSQLSVDIDQPWIYIHKGGWYSVASLLRSLLRFEISGMLQRLFTLLGKRRDPGDSYALLQKTEKELGTPVKYFILCRGNQKYDKNRSLKRKEFRELLRNLDSHQQLGIHPSFASHQDPSLLDEELELLSGILERKINMSRQHYLLFRFPQTCQQLIAKGITADYTLGYSSQTGFRTGLARSCNFYDLTREEETEFRLTPLIIMDRTLKDYMKLEPEQAIREYDYYHQQIRQVGGEFVFLWHNDALSDQGEWRGWLRVFEHVIQTHSAS